MIIDNTEIKRASAEIKRERAADKNVDRAQKAPEQPQQPVVGDDSTRVAQAPTDGSDAASNAAGSHVAPTLQPTPTHNPPASTPTNVTPRTPDPAQPARQHQQFVRTPRTDRPPTEMHAARNRRVRSDIEANQWSPARHHDALRQQLVTSSWAGPNPADTQRHLQEVQRKIKRWEAEEQDACERERVERVERVERERMERERIAGDGPEKLADAVGGLKKNRGAAETLSRSICWLLKRLETEFRDFETKLKAYERCWDQATQRTVAAMLETKPTVNAFVDANETDWLEATSVANTFYEQQLSLPIGQAEPARGMPARDVAALMDTIATRVAGRLQELEELEQRLEAGIKNILETGAKALREAERVARVEPPNPPEPVQPTPNPVVLDPTPPPNPAIQAQLHRRMKDEYDRHVELVKPIVRQKQHTGRKLRTHEALRPWYKGSPLPEFLAYLEGNLGSNFAEEQRNIARHLPEVVRILNGQHPDCPLNAADAKRKVMVAIASAVVAPSNGKRAAGTLDGLALVVAKLISQVQEFETVFFGCFALYWPLSVPCYPDQSKSKSTGPEEGDEKTETEFFFVPAKKPGKRDHDANSVRLLCRICLSTELREHRGAGLGRAWTWLARLTQLRSSNDPFVRAGTTHQLKGPYKVDYKVPFEIVASLLSSFLGDLAAPEDEYRNRCLYYQLGSKEAFGKQYRKLCEKLKGEFIQEGDKIAGHLKYLEQEVVQHVPAEKSKLNSDTATGYNMNVEWDNLRRQLEKVP